MPLEDGVHLVHRPGILWADVEGEVVLYDAGASRAHLLSPSGSVLWPALSSPVTVAELAEDVAAVFAIPMADASEQIATFCEQLLAMEVVEAVDERVDEP